MTTPADRDALIEMMAEAAGHTTTALAIMERVLTAIEKAGCAVVPVVMTVEWLRRAEAFAADNADLVNYPVQDGFNSALAASPYRRTGT